MLTWKEVARHFWHGRQLARQQEVRLKKRLWAEHTNATRFVSAMTILLPRLAVYGEFCRACDSRISDGHRNGCNYLAALAALNEAAKSVDVA